MKRVEYALVSVAVDGPDRRVIRRCPSCSGRGYVQHGPGFAKCPADGCSGGWVVKETT